MARPELRLLVAMVVLTAGCDARSPAAGQASITVKLPPPRADVAAPAFSFKDPGKARSR